MSLAFIYSQFEMNQVSNLLSAPFFSYSLEEQLEIKQLGRPTPDLGILKSQSLSKGKRTRKFNKAIYDKNDWICGCDEAQALFCFPCVLFGGEVTWSETGTTDLIHIWEKIKNHEKSKVHMNNVFNLFMLGRSHSDPCPRSPSSHKRDVEEYNALVEKNRYVLNVMVDCIRLCGRSALALQGEVESRNDGLFEEMLEFTTRINQTMREHFHKSSAFKRSASSMQKELLQCMLEVYRQEVAKEVEEIDYVAMIIDETIGASNEFHLGIIFRYIAKGKPVERFWSVVKPAGYDSASITQCILKELEPLTYLTPKVIAYSYDGASICTEVFEEVQRIMKQTYTMTNYVHHYAHGVDVVLSSAVASSRSAQIFLAHLSGICEYFSSSPERMRLLEAMVQEKSVEPLDVNLNSGSNAVNVVLSYRQELISVMEILQSSEDVKSKQVIERAGAYLLRLKDPEFVFWLHVFDKILPLVDDIFDRLQSETTDTSFFTKHLYNFEQSVMLVREQMDRVVDSVILEFWEDEPTAKRQRTDTWKDQTLAALEICDSIVLQINSRFSFKEHFLAAALFSTKNFPLLHIHFPDDLMHALTNAFVLLERSRWKLELQVIYQREDMRDFSEGVVGLLSLLSSQEMRQTFPDAVMLLKMLVTMPMKTTEGNRRCKTLERVKAFLKGVKRVVEDTDALGVLFVEESFLKGLDDFNKRVIDLFASSEERRKEFLYRTV